MEFCGLCKREVKDWVTHIHSEEHQRNSREVLIKRGVINDGAKSGS